MIRDLIVQTPYQPGERLPPEREIAEMLNVTRTVVREALIMLEIKGLVDVRRGAGIYVLDNADRRWVVVFLINDPRSRLGKPAMDALLRWVAERQ